MDLLTTEIVKRIVADIGAVPGFVGRRGLTDTNFRLVKTIKIKYDDCDREHDVYSGKLTLKGESCIKGLLVDLTVDDSNEYLFMFRMDDLPIYAAQISYDPEQEEGSFKKLNIKDNNETWEPLGMFNKARMLADFERIVSWGLMWEDCKETQDLFDAAVKLIDSQRY